MKFVHIADMHFDTSFTQINDSNLGNLRRLDQRKVFKKVINYIKENNIDYLFIAGDLYEHNYIKETTIDFINNMFKEIPGTKVFIAPGNHDPYIKNSYYNTYQWNDNVKIFGPKMEMISEKDVNIYGYGFDDFYYVNSELNNFEISDKKNNNILITHATLNGTNNIDKQYNAIPRYLLESIGFDYVALGHIHKNNYTTNERIIYPGSTISIGFDEPGEHGMVVGELIEGQLTTKFVPLDETEFKVIDVDISEFKSIEELVDYLNCMNINEKNYYEIYITGERNFEIDMYNLKKLIQIPNILKIKNKTKLSLDLESISNEKTLKGLFVKEIMEQLKNEDCDKQLLESALEIGLEILEK